MNDAATTPEDTSRTINVLANDTDVDGDSLTYSLVSGPSNGDLTFTFAQNPATPRPFGVRGSM